MFLKLFDQFKWEVVGLLLVALVAFYLFHVARVGMLEASLTSTTESLGRLQVEKAALLTANRQALQDIDKQNLQVQVLRSAMVDKAHAAEAAVAEVRRDAEKWRIKYTAIFPRPPSAKDECLAVSGLLSQYHSLRVSEMKEATP